MRAWIVAACVAQVGCTDAVPSQKRPSQERTGRASGALVWADETELLAGDGGEYDAFGRSVAIDGDTLIAGAAFDSDTVSGGAHRERRRER